MGEIDEVCELMCLSCEQDPSKPDCDGISHQNNPNDTSKADCDVISHHNNSNDLNSSCVTVPGADPSDLNDSCSVVSDCETSDDSGDLNSYSAVEQGIETRDDDSSDLNDSSTTKVETGDDSSDLDDSCVVVAEAETGVDSNDFDNSCEVEAGVEIGVDSRDLYTLSEGKVEEIDEFPPLVNGTLGKKESSYEEHFGKTKSWAKVVTIPWKSFPAKVNFLDAENEILETINRDVKDPSTPFVANVEVEVCNGKITTDLNGDSSDYKNVDSSIILETEHDEDMGDDLDGTAASSTNEELYAQENCHIKNISVASSEDFGADVINGDHINITVATKPFNFLIRAPKFDDGSLVEQVRLAKLQLDEKAKVRDAIQLQVKEKRANSQIHALDYENTKGGNRSPRDLVKSKRMEIDSLLLMVNKAKNASSIEHMNSQICNMEHMIQHETLPLNEEKKLVREISQLNQHRRKLLASFGSKDEIRQILEQREEFEERLKILKEELDVLKGSALKAQEIALDESKKIRAANDVRQAAYVKLQRLKKKLFEKNKHFYKYKDDATLASNYASTRDAKALYRLCMNHVDNFMELWNKNDEFRREYVRFNARSSVRRFGTLDGRSLGLDEVPPVLPSHVHERAKIVSTDDLESQTEEKKQEKTTENTTSEDEKMKKAAYTGLAIPLHLNGRLDYSDSDSGKGISHEEPEKSRDEIDAELKEKHRLEEIDKANKARERKKRLEEKLQMRAEVKAQKEAEQKEKEREKRLRKKERKKAAAAAAAAIHVNAIEKATSSESALVTSNEIPVEEISSSVAPKKPPKSLLLTKQRKAKYVAPLTRGRNKKKLQQLMWACIAIVVILLVLWLVRTRVFPNLTIEW